MSILKDEFKLGLKQRIQADAPAQFPSTGWEKIALGKFYPGVDAASSLTLISVALGTVLGTVMKGHNFCLTDAQLHQFFAGVSTDMKPSEAIDQMLLVAGMAVPCPPSAAGDRI
ncbi:MAG: hypothetical protein M3Z85_18655 [Acidobacteriota bacterium]|nr:hypothetical protein [Acidobacteriota bacterium]